MYEAKHLEANIFDLESGYLQTSVGSNSNKMPLSYFVTYNNTWWMPIIYKIKVPSISYNPRTETGFIILNIYYDQTHIFRGMQYTKFKGDKIDYIRTYASPVFFTANSSDPKVRLDGYGNSIWLQSGYDLNYSMKAAQLFFKSPVGRNFSKNNQTKEAVKAIKENIIKYFRPGKHGS